MKSLKNRYLIPILAILQLIISMFFARSVSAQEQIQQFDDRVLISLAARRTPEQTHFMRFMSNTYRYGEVGVPAGLLIGGIISNDYQMRQNALYMASSTAITFGLTLLVKQIIKRPRPFVRNLKIISVYQPGEYSFPSGHSSTTFSTAMAVSNAYPKWYVIAPSFLWAGTVSYSRMYLGVHYPTDVAAGAILGTGTALLLAPLKK
jgi:membrane-associated phospholipid phosphatase